MNLYTSGKYLENNPDWHEGGAAWKARRIHEFMIQNSIAPKRIAEVGCGAGGVIAGVHERFDGQVECRGFDISPQAIEIAKRRAKPKLSYHLEDIRGTAERFDVLMLIDVFEHVEDYFGFLRSFRPNAEYFLFHIPLEISLYNLLRPGSLQATRQRVGHLHFFWKEQALASLADCGFSILASEYSLPLDRWPEDLPREATTSLKLKAVRALTALTWKVSPDVSARVFGTTSLLVLAKAESKG